MHNTGNRWQNNHLGDDNNNGSNCCPVCGSTGYIDSWRIAICYFCNGTGEYTKAAATFMKIHPCQCVHSDRENCPLCKQKCHHSTNNKPKVLITSPPPPSPPR